MTNIDDKDLENISGAGDGSDFQQQINISPTKKPTKDPLLVEGPSEEPIGGSSGVTEVEDLSGLGGGRGDGDFQRG